MMPTDTEYLQCLGLGLQGLRASGQFCDAMVCVGSTRILVHKVVLSAASKTLHDMALEFDMTPHRERDQLEIIIPPDVSLYAVNMFINFIYTGQLELNDRVVNHIQRLATIFGVSRLLIQCQEYIQRTTAPDSQNLNLSEENQIEPDSSCTNGAQQANNEERSVGMPEEISLDSSLTRSNSACSGFEVDQKAAFGNVSVKSEPIDFASYKALQPLTGQATSLHHSAANRSPTKGKQPQNMAASMTMLEKLMSPVVNIKKLPSNITPDVVVLVSDDENDDQETSANSVGQTQFKIKPSHQYTLEEKEAIAIEAKRFGTTQISNSKNIPLPDILSWMSLFGLRNPGFQKLGKHGKQVNHDADLSLVRWIVQQQEMNGSVDLNSMKQYALTVYRQTQPKFVASKTWLGNFLQRNMSVLQGTKFVHGEGNQIDVYGNGDSADVSVKQELMPVEDEVISVGDSGEHVLETLGQHTVLESVPLNEEMLINEAVGVGLNDDDDDNEDINFDMDLSSEYMANVPQEIPNVDDVLRNCRTQGTIQTPFGKRPIIIGQAKCFDAKSERKIVQWVLERNARDGYVFTDDFKEYARTLYKGEKYFGATQAWMKKFLRRNRVLKDVKFCSKFKNSYSQEEKVAAVALARRFGTTYAAKHTGISDKMIHSWRLAMDRGQMNPAASVINRMDVVSPPTGPLKSPTSTMTKSSSSTSLSDKSATTTTQALHGIVPEFENRIIQQMKEYQSKEGSINYDEISKISQSVYKETRPMFKASYSWIRTFLDRHKEEVKGIELENVSKVLIEDENSQSGSRARGLSSERITEMVNTALQEIEAQESFKTSDNGTILINSEKVASNKRPIVVGPSVMFTRKTEKLLVEWALERQNRDGYVFTDDFKEFAKSHHVGPKHFSASSGWMSLFLRRHRVLKDVKWKSKFKNNYTEEEKMAAIAEAKRLGTGHVGRKLGIDPALICAWRIKMEKSSQKQTFWKGTKIRKFGKGSKLLMPKFAPLKLTADMGSDAARGIVPEFEQRIVELILEHHAKEGSTSYEEMSRISQSVYKETRANFKASYAWIRNFMKRHEDQLKDLNIDNVKKVFMPEDDAGDSSLGAFGSGDSDMQDFQLEKLFSKRPIIVGQSRSLDTKTEKKLVQWLIEQQEKNGYVFLDQFKTYAQSLYKGEKKFAATQAWRIKFLRRNHAAVKHVRFTSSFRNQYSLEEKKAIVLESKKFGAAHVSKKTGIDHCLINSWRNKLERSGDIPVDDPTVMSDQNVSSRVKFPAAQGKAQFVSKLKQMETSVGPGLYSFRGIVPTFEKKILMMVQDHMDNEGSVSYQDVSNIARAVYKETRPHFKACYNWIKDFIKRHKKELRHVEFENTKKILIEDDNGTEILIPDDRLHDMESLMKMNEGYESFSKAPNSESNNESMGSWESYSEMEETEKTSDPMIVIDNPEDPNYESHAGMYGKVIPGTSKATIGSESGIDIEKIASKRPIIIGTPVHFDRKTEKKMVEWLLERQKNEEFVFTDDFTDYAKSLYTGRPGKFAATNAWITKFMRRSRLEKKIRFQSKLKGNNLKYEEKIIEFILEHQEKEGSVSNDDIQKITQSVYKDIRPNFRACYNWIKDFIKRHKDELADVELENVKKFYIPDEDERDGVLIRDYDPMKGLSLADTSADLGGQAEMEYSTGFEGENSHDGSWMDLDNSTEGFNRSKSHTPQQANQSSLINKLVNRKRPIIIAPPKTMDIKTEKKLVQWMLEQQEKNGCVYLDLFKEYAISIHTGPKKFCATQAWMIKFKQRNHQALKGVQIRSRFRKEYSNEEKIAAVEEARRLGCHHVGRKLGINGGVIYTWKVQLEQAEKLEAFQGFGGGTPEVESYSRGMIPEFEQKIVDTVLELQKTKGGVSYDDISQTARTVYQETRPNFKASNNWVLEFIRKNKDAFENVTFENQRKFLTEEEKLHILSEEKKYGTDHVVKKRNISASTIYHWKRHMQSKSIPIPKYKALVGSKIKKKYARGKKSQKTYTLEEKRNVVRVVEENGFTYASLKLGISRNLIAKWVKYFRDQGEDIVVSFTKASTGKKDLEQQIVKWVLEQNDQLGIVMTNRIQAYGKKVFEEAYTKYNATDHWLEAFISQNGETFQNVRFREKGDTDLEFTDEIKLKLARYSEKYGAVETADKTGLTPKNIYHWRRILRQKGYDLTRDSSNDGAIAAKEREGEATLTPTVATSEPKSLMQQKLEKISQRYSVNSRRTIVAEANAEGASTIASKHKIPLPLLLNWMKTYDVKPDMAGLDMPHSSGSTSSKDSTPDSSFQTKLKVKLPSVEKAKSGYNKHSEEFKREVCVEAKKIGVMETVRKRGVANSTIYAWLKEFERDRSIERKSSERSSFERSRSSMDSERETSSTPISLTKIKTESGLSDDDPHGTKIATASENVSDLYQSYKPRKYTEAEKMDVVRRALEIGYKPTAEELGIPVSNVRRWTETFNKRVKQSENSEKKKEKYRELKTSRHLSQSESDTDSSLNTSIGSEQRNSGEGNLVGGDGQTDKSVGLKRKLIENSPDLSELAKKRRLSSQFNDEEKMAFVQESELVGARAAAVSAGVSIDVLYKWRSKYLHKSFKGTTSVSPYKPSLPISSPPVSDATTTSSIRKLLESPSASLSDVRLTSSGFNIHSPSLLDIHSSSTSADKSFDPQSPSALEIAKTIQLDFGSSDGNQHDGNNLLCDNPLEVLPHPADSLGNTNLISDFAADFQQIETSAANQILEMTVNYMEAEKAHESFKFGFDADEVELLELDKTDEEVSKTVHDSTIEKQTTYRNEESTGGIGLIRISNIKSEASVE